MVFGRTNFHFLNDGSCRMLNCFLHWNEATGDCASGFVNCFGHVNDSCSFQVAVKTRPRSSGLTSDWAIRS